MTTINSNNEVINLSGMCLAKIPLCYSEQGKFKYIELENDINDFISSNAGFDIVIQNDKDCTGLVLEAYSWAECVSIQTILFSKYCF